MNKYVNCIAHKSSEGNLLIGNKQSALIDCGMAFCAKDTIHKVKDALKGKPLDYLFLSHSHYDHIGALPFFRKEWPLLQTVTSEAGAAILMKDTPRRVIRELSLAAAEIYNTGSNNQNFDILNWDSKALFGDIIVKEGDIISLGDLAVMVLETPGHTRDSLSFFVPELELLILNETLGVLMSDGTVFPCYLSSYSDTIKSTEKCAQIKYKQLSLPHRGITSNIEAEGFFGKSLASNAACYNFIQEMKNKNHNEDEMLELFHRQYSSELLLSYQPKEAFIANALAMFSCKS